jgi:hypothetical protein
MLKRPGLPGCVTRWGRNRSEVKFPTLPKLRSLWGTIQVAVGVTYRTVLLIFIFF